MLLALVQRKRAPAQAAHGSSGSHLDGERAAAQAASGSSRSSGGHLDGGQQGLLPAGEAEPGSVISSDDDASADMAARSGRRDFMMKKLKLSTSDPGAPNRKPRLRFPSVAWWALPLQDAVASKWEALHSRHGGGALRKIRLHEACAGLGAATVACDTLGIPLAPERVMSEGKAHAQRVLVAGASAKCHVVSSMAEHSVGHGTCHVHGQCCKFGEEMLDVLVSGPPCQPFSGQRADHHVSGYQDM